MKKLIFWMMGFFCLVSACFALEQAFTDLPSSVEVLPVFTISLDRNQIDFGPVEPGSPKILGEPGYFNEIRCRSNYGRTWYLKAEVLSGPRLAGGNFSLPLEAFKFKVSSATAQGQPKAKLQFEPFEKKSNIIYTSFGDENLGKQVVLRFQYQFIPSSDTPAGNYTGQILFTMADTP